MRASATACDLWLYEREAWAAGHQFVVGLDEVGRGPLAGPVVAACVVLPSSFDIAGIGDSKTLTERQRERAEVRIRAEALALSLGIVDAATIDRVNILQASRQAMREALLALSLSPTLALVDGLPVPDLPCPQQRAIIKGDSLSASIAAASIIAKVYRDQLMRDWHDEYPEYGFVGHKGYGSAQHLAALHAHGPCPLHRRSFAPVAAAIRTHASP